LKIARISLLIPILVLGTIVAPNAIHLAHAATGEVCLADPTTASSASSPCPTSLPVFSGPVGQQIRIGVFIQGSDALSGFDITLLADHTVLVPTGVDITGTVLPGATTVILECTQGILKAGSVCAQTDTINTLQFVVTAGLGLITTPPTSGLLFTAIYNITSTTAAGGIPIGFQSGCPGTSVSGVCVTIANGSTTANAETPQSGSFDNSAAATMAFVVFSFPATSFGPEFPGTSNTEIITATAMNGYPGVATDSITFTTTATPGVTATLSGTNPCSTNGTSCAVSLSLTGTSAGNYFVTVSGTYASTDASGNSDTLVTTATIAVIVYDFGFTVSPTSTSLASGSTTTVHATLSSLNGFTGPVTVSTGTVIPSSPPLTISYTPSSVTLTTGATQTSNVTLSASPAQPTTYHVVIRATSALRVKNSPTLTVTVNLGHSTTTSLACVPSSVPVNNSSVCNGTVTDTSTSPSTPTGTVSFSSNSTGVFMPTASCLLSAGTAGMASCQVSYTPTATGAGSHAITGLYSGDSAHAGSSGKFALTVTPPRPNFIITANPMSIAIPEGVTGTSTITVSAIDGFAGNVSLTVMHPSSTTMLCNITSGFIIGTTTTFLGCGDTVPGVNNVTVTGTSGNLTHSVSIIFIVNSNPDFSMSAYPAAVGTTVGNNGTSTITIIPQNLFSGTVTLTVSSLTGIFCSVNPMSILTKGSATLSCAGSQPGTYGVTVTATSGSITHSVLITFTVLLQTTSTGIVCIASADAATCPVVGPIIQGPLPNPGTQFRIAVLADSSQALDGFDITLLTNSTVLVPLGVQVGPVLANTHTIVECIGGVNKLGSTSCPTTDTVGTIEYGVVGELTTQPITGVLFYAVFNVTSTSYSSPITFQTGCTNTSVASGTCVSISNGSTKLVPEAVQTARFNNLPYFDLIPSASTVVVFQGATDSSQFISVTSLNGFGGTTGGTVNLGSSSSSNGAVVTLSPNSVVVSTNSNGLAGLTVIVPRTTLPGTYTLTIKGTSGTLPSNSITISLVVIASDFLISTTSNALTIIVGSNAATTVNIVSGSGFTGTILLSANVSAPGLTTNLNPPIVTLTTTSFSASSTMTIATSQTTLSGLYLVRLTGASGSVAHSVTIEVIVRSPIFAIGANPESLYLRAGDSGESSITASSIDGFNGTITLSTTVTPPVGLEVSLTTTTFYLPASPVCCSPYSLLVVTTTATTAPGLYLVTLTATNGTLTERVPISITVVLPPPPTFSMSSDPAFLYVQAGLSTTSVITFSAMTGFTGTVSVAATVSPTVISGKEPIVTLSSNSVTLTSGGVQMLTLQFTSDRSTPPNQYLVTILGRSGNLTVTATITVQVQPPPDIPPVADFTISPSNPIVGQQITFDGSSSFDPDGTVVSWTWNLGNGFGSLTFNNPFFYTTYPLPGNYTVTLTVQDNAGLAGSRSMIVSVRPQPAHDVSILSVNVQGEVVATQLVGISVQVRNDGISNETVSIMAYANGRAIQTLHNVFLQGCQINQYQNFCYSYYYEDIIWNTTGYVPGNYTISASISLPAGEVDPTPADNSLTGGVVSVFPAPILTITPNTGGVGAKVTISGSGFLPPVPGYGSQGPLWVTFDDMFLGYNFNGQNGTFTFTFDVPQSQAGPHLIKAFNLYSGARASATFTVTPTAGGSLAVTINTGSVYFPGDKVVAYILTTLNGVPTGPSNVQLTVTLFFSNGTSRSMTTASLGSGLYEAVYTVPTTGPLGTYAIVAKAHMTGPLDASSMATFEVKLSWLTSNKNTIMTVGTLAGLIGLVGVAWKKGYLRRKDNRDPQASLY
jgi:hypothetical protein